MVLDFQDKGKYFRGLLILIGKDGNIDANERKSILKICEKLGFESKFSNEAVKEFLENEFIDNTPPKFSSQEIAFSFLKDAINLALVDSDFHTEELEWLEKVASSNGIPNNWLDKELQRTIKKFKSEESLNI